MANSQLLRRFALGACLAVTVAAALWPVEELPPRTPRAARSAHLAAQVPVQVASHAPSVPHAAESVDIDPFMPRGWLPEAPPVTEAVAPPPVAQAEPFVGPMPPAPPPPAPALPFQFMGRLNDGGVPVVYLTRGDEALVARSGDTLEHTYKIVNISATQLEFVHLPTGEKQTMSLPAPGD